MSMRLCESVEKVGLLKFKGMMLILLKKEGSQLSKSNGEDADTAGWAGFTSQSVVLNRNLGLCLLLVIRSAKKACLIS